MANKHTLSELQTLQALPLSLKVKKTQQRIREWVNEYGVDGVSVSFSGGKDSTVLLHIVREMYPEAKAVFADTMEFPELREFVKTFDNVDWIKPKMSYVEVVKKYGYPMISKEVSECVYGARRYLKSVLTSLAEDETVVTDRQLPYYYEKVLDIADGRHPKEVNGGWRRFGLLTGTFTADCRIDKRLYKNSRQSESAKTPGSEQQEGQNDAGSYP